MSFADVRFLWLTRDDLQSWISANLRRQIIGYRYCKRYNAQVNDSTRAFLELNELPYMQLSFEDLVLRPQRALERLNAFLDLRLGIDDLRAAYDKPLYRTRGVRDFMLAAAIHGKNYAERIDEGSLRARRRSPVINELSRSRPPEISRRRGFAS
jgi:hypothetical protein